MNRVRRRHLVGGLVSAGLLPCCSWAVNPAPDAALAALERRLGGRLGLFALDTASGRSLAHRPDEAFAMCSTFKWLLAAAVLARVDAGTLRLQQPVPCGPADLLDWAPVAREHLRAGQVSVQVLARAVVTVSDNTAANLLLRLLGGPAALTAWMRSLGNSRTRLDRWEPELNANLPGDERDSTTPRAMVQLMQAVLVQRQALSAPSRALLLRWLQDCETGNDRLRAGLPRGWRAGDKTGTGERGAVNDVALAWPRGRERTPLLIACYLSEGTAPRTELVAAHAEVARCVVQAFGLR
jgi:beta-lactamase class A